MRTRWDAAIPFGGAHADRHHDAQLALGRVPQRPAGGAAERLRAPQPQPHRAVRRQARRGAPEPPGAPADLHRRPPKRGGRRRRPAAALRADAAGAQLLRGSSLTVSASRWAAGVAGPPLPARRRLGAPPPGCGVGAGPRPSPAAAARPRRTALARVGSGSVACGAGVTSNDTDARASAAIGSAVRRRPPRPRSSATSARPRRRPRRMRVSSPRPASAAAARRRGRGPPRRTSSPADRPGPAPPRPRRRRRRRRRGCAPPGVGVLDSTIIVEPPNDQAGATRSRYCPPTEAAAKPGKPRASTVAVAFAPASSYRHRDHVLALPEHVSRTHQHRAGAEPPSRSKSTRSR